MAENNNDAKQSRKDSKRDAKIEAKRRKLAEQRAQRAAEAAQSQTVAEDKTAESPVREVTADSANRERRAIIQESDLRPRTEKPEPQETVTLADIQPADKAVAVKASGKSKAVGILGAIGAGLLKALKWIFRKIRNVNWTPKYIAACCFALLALLFIIWGALEFADYSDKKPELYITDDGFHHDDKFDGCAVLHGIDVSEHQKNEINWERVKSSGADYVFIRAGYRAADNGSLHTDEKFKENMKGAEKAGLMVGVYFYSQALTPGEGKEEAEYVLDLIKDYDITMPVVIDYEIYEGGRLDKKIQAGELYAASLYHDIVLGFTNTVEAAGYESAVYANNSMLTNYMQADILDDMATIWLARYDSVANLDADYWFWQCSDNGKAGGIEGSVDKNFWYMQPEKVYETRAKHSKRAISVRDCRISFKRSVTRLRNFRAVPKFDMTYEGKGMKKGRDYVYSIVKNTQPGTGYVIIRGVGKYKDWIMYPFKIE